ncbi:MAG TPA: energy transducer TonB [Candidatus Angelobacter sp.]|nr:energy transducer TonB [Candidatus Angelobacter sp.]
MKKALTFIFLALAIRVQITPAFASELEKTLKSQYGKHVLGLRSPIQGTHLKFDSTGKLVAPLPPGRWLAYGGIRVEKISLRPDKLHLEGPWVGFATDKQGKPLLVPLGKPIKIEIRLDSPANSADDVRALLERVFFPDDNDIQHVLPEFRRDDFVDTESIHKFRITSETIHNFNTKKEAGVTAPVPVDTPEPEFSSEARHNKYQGSVVLEVVVDKSGTVSRIRIVRALGMGLDLQAVEKVETWRFQPASRNGQPVAVTLNIEVSFNLY